MAALAPMPQAERQDDDERKAEVLAESADSVFDVSHREFYESLSTYPLTRMMAR